MMSSASNKKYGRRHFVNKSINKSRKIHTTGWGTLAAAWFWRLAPNFLTPRHNRKINASNEENGIAA
jgi:hypothetical protein